MIFRKRGKDDTRTIAKLNFNDFDMKADKTHKAGKVEIESQSVSSKVVKQKQQLYVAVFMNINIRSEDGEKVKK